MRAWQIGDLVKLNIPNKVDVGTIVEIRSQRVVVEDYAGKKLSWPKDKLELVASDAFFKGPVDLSIS